jgi:hypothetical protein
MLEGINERRAQEYRHSVWSTWHIAALGRVKDMPSLTQMLGEKKEQVQGIDEAAILGMLQRLEKRQKGNG